MTQSVGARLSGAPSGASELWPTNSRFLDSQDAVAGCDRLQPVRFDDVVAVRCRSVGLLLSRSGCEEEKVECRVSSVECCVVVGAGRVMTFYISMQLCPAGESRRMTIRMTIGSQTANSIERGDQ